MRGCPYCPYGECTMRNLCKYGYCVRANLEQDGWIRKDDGTLEHQVTESGATEQTNSRDTKLSTDGTNG
jgi:hypothetical protein